MKNETQLVFPRGFVFFQLLTILLYFVQPAWLPESMYLFFAGIVVVLFLQGLHRLGLENMNRWEEAQEVYPFGLGRGENKWTAYLQDKHETLGMLSQDFSQSVEEMVRVVVYDDGPPEFYLSQVFAYDRAREEEGGKVFTLPLWREYQRLQNQYLRENHGKN